MRKIVLTFGLIAGGILSAMMLITIPFFQAQADFDSGAIIGYTTMVVAFLMVFFGTKSYRDNVAGGSVAFGRAFAVGLLITLVASACYVATWEFIYYRITPDFVERYSAHTIEKARKAGATDEQIVAKQQEMADFAKMYSNPLINISFTFLEPLPVGLLFTLVTAGVLSRKKKVAITSPS